MEDNGYDNEILEARALRLIKEEKELKKAIEKSGFVSIESTRGNPPDLYTINIKINTFVNDFQTLKIRKSEENISIRLFCDLNYPLSPPLAFVVRGFPFNPNISDKTGAICYTAKYSPKTSLTLVLQQIIEILRFQSINIEERSMNPEAAMWCRANMNEFPTDQRRLLNIEPVDIKADKDEEFLDIEICY